MKSDCLFKIDVEDFQNKMSEGKEYTSENLRAYKGIVMEKKMYYFVITVFKK